MNTRCSDFIVRFESDVSIGRRPGEIQRNLLDWGDISMSSKGFCINSGVRYRQPPMRRNLFWLGAFLTIVFTIFAKQPSPSTPEGNFDVIIRNGTVYDGTGAEPLQADVAIRGARIAGVGDFKSG